ncbi:CocE/NonD family hydrolase C-terminal non-catalytic domain-containing protein [Streptomyces sp. NPDC055722]
MRQASHREVDEKRTTEGNPYHPHTRAVPVEPGKIEEYVLRLYPFAATFQPGHRLVVELSNDEPLADAHNALLRRTPFTCRWATPAPTRSTATPRTPPGWCCRSRRSRRRTRRDRALYAPTTETGAAAPDKADAARGTAVPFLVSEQE